MVPSEGRDNTQQPPESPLARVPTQEWATGEVIVPPSFVPPADALWQVQAMLTKLGYDPGPVDGIMGPKTVAALRHYESANNLPRGGTFDVLHRPTRAKPVMAAENQSEPTSLLPDIMVKATPF
jgi:peptidoglycan hydrolase-like protein with peptidoglycan-binding domain